ncbi:MAG: Gfo/Idh/MocA family oxidoreductase [Planctomycetota bacterium]
MNPKSPRLFTSRREFLAKSATAGAMLAGGLSLARSAHAAGSDIIRIGLVGCGGRGTGAAVNALKNAAGAKLKLVVMADAFSGPLEISLKNIRKECKDQPDLVDVTPERRFAGLDSYQNLIDSGVDMVLLCSPPGFRPAHFEAAVKAGKNVFMEKPVATDSPGVRRVLAANEDAKKKGLLVSVGHHLRHEDRYREAVQKIHDGAIGDLNFLRVYFNTVEIWIRPRQPSQTEFQYQVNNWYYFTWLSGDHIAEQHVHDIDVGNWIAQGYPVEAEGIGGRQVRIGKEYGEIFDHHTVEFTFANGLKMFSYCRQINETGFNYSQHAHGTKGRVDLNGVGNSFLSVNGQKPIRWRVGADGHQKEMDDFFAAMLAGKPYNEADNGAKSTMTAIMGRMATYSGQVIRWDKAINSQRDLSPKILAWDADTPVKPRPDGTYACAMPGRTKPY